MGGRYDDRLGNRIMPEMAARTSLKSHARANKSSTKLEFCKRLCGQPTLIGARLTP
jgi:hypothetical protein